MTARILFSTVAATFVACGTADPSTAPGSDGAVLDAAAEVADETPPVRSLLLSARVGEQGISEPLSFVVPPNTRSLTVIVGGRSSSLLALASLRTADAVEHVGIDLATDPGPAMTASYQTEQTGLMPGDLYQSIRLGTFTHVYPYAPGQLLPVGAATLRVAASEPSQDVTVRLLMPEDDGAKTLHFHALSLSKATTSFDPAPFVAVAQPIFDQVGIRLVVDGTTDVVGSDLSTIADSTEPQEAPTSSSALVALLGHERLPSSAALKIFVVDALPPGITGLSLGTPGPPDATSYYFGVLLRRGSAATLGRVFAHEVSHFLALQHVVNRGVSGKLYPDPLGDTEPRQGNLMEDGTKLTPDQGFALTRSALLTKD